MQKSTPSVDCYQSAAPLNPQLFYPAVDQFKKNKGFVLLLIVLALLAIGAAALVTGLAGNRALDRRIGVGATSDQRLLLSKDALVGAAIGNIADSGRPGQLPAPDTLQDGNYDGTANNFGCLDGTAVNGLPALSSDNANMRCLGKFPWKSLGIPSDGADENDVSGIMPWYAVSANLASSTSCLTFLNPATVAATPITFGCPSNSAPPYPWLKVCDQTGRLLSDRVAFVLIVPGAPIETSGRTQTRIGSPRPRPADYLDAIPVPAGWAALPAAQRCTTYDNAALNNEFVTADTTNGFNDRLLFVTIEELMAHVERRVAQQVRESLVRYETAYGRYPWLAPIVNPSSVTDAFVSTSGTVTGLVPFHNTSQKFKTELNWTINTLASDDTLTPAVSSSPVSLCFGGTFECRLRTSPGNASVPRTVTSPQFQPFKSSGVATPDVLCSYSSLATLECDPYVVTTQTQAVTYNVERRVCCSGTYSAYGTYAGTQTRTITLTPSISASAAVFSSDVAQFVRRSLTTASTFNVIGQLTAADKWSSATLDATASFQTGFATTDGTGVVTMSNVRVYPVLPTWYADHKWNEFIYAAISPDASPAVGGRACAANCLSAGVRTGLNAVVISSGKMINTQNRYVTTPSVTDFLEAPNVSGASTRIFAETSASQSSTYADTVVTIPH